MANGQNGIFYAIYIKLYTGTHELTVIDNLSSREAKPRLSGNIAIDAQANGIVLLRQEDAVEVANWKYSAVKTVEVTPTDVPQDLDKILRILITGENGWVMSANYEVRTAEFQIAQLVLSTSSVHATR